jgi:prolyl oligopeptidase PreP (S9A serine peptidase family)
MSESMVIAVPMLNSTTGIFGCSVSKDEKKTVPPSNETRPVAVAQTGESISSKDVMQLSFQKNKDIIWNSQSTPEQISDAIDLVCESGGDAEQIKGLLMDIAKGERVIRTIRNKAFKILKSSYPQDKDAMQLLKEIDRKDQAEANRILIYLHNRQDGAVKNPFNGFQR